MVGAAASGEESVRLAETLLPDLVLMDINLPGIDGRRLPGGCATRQPLARGASISTQDEDVGDGFAAESGAAAYIL